jgi:Zn finger protein HypA/HybF involved in hydrogenase expression
MEKTGIMHPENFSVSYDFRRCEKCSAKVLVKENWFYCYECGSELPQKWNFE